MKEVELLNRVVLLLDGEENDPLSPEYILTDGDRRVINALVGMWRRGGQGPHYEKIELKIEEGKPLGLKNFRDMAINSMALRLFERGE